MTEHREVCAFRPGTRNKTPPSRARIALTPAGLRGSRMGRRVLGIVSRLGVGTVPAYGSRIGPLRVGSRQPALKPDPVNTRPQERFTGGCPQRTLEGVAVPP